MGLRLDYNSPVVLSFTLLCIAIYIANSALGNALTPFIALDSHFSFNSVTDYLTLFTYTLGHSSVEHLLGNFTLFVLLGPVIEEKYGSKKLQAMMAITALITAILHILFFKEGLWGASGLVFMLITLISFTNVKEGHIPVTFIVVLLLFVGKEVFASLKTDQVSQFAHIIGGLCGGLFGFSKWFR